LYITQLLIRNFMDLYQTHIYKFQKGINIIHEPPESGDTTLGNAIRFAFFGSMLEPNHSLFNERCLRESKETEISPTISVSLEITENDSNHTIDRRLYQHDHHGDTWLDERLHYSRTNNPLTPNHEIYDLIYVNKDRITNETGIPEATKETMRRYLEEKITLNQRKNINLIILDNITTHLKPEEWSQLTETLLETHLDQIIIIEPTNTHREAFSSPTQFLVYNSGVDLQLLHLTVKDFPFPAEKLRSMVYNWYTGYYFTKGASYIHDLFDHEYKITVTEAEPDGAHFSYTTKLEITENEKT